MRGSERYITVETLMVVVVVDVERVVECSVFITRVRGGRPGNRGLIGLNGII